MADEKKKDAKAGAKAPKGEKPAKGDRPEKAAKGEAAAAEAKPKDKAPSANASRPVPPARLKKYYEEKVVPELMKRFEYSNRMQVPRLTKIVVNMGVGEAI